MSLGLRINPCLNASKRLIADGWLDVVGAVGGRSVVLGTEKLG